MPPCLQIGRLTVVPLSNNGDFKGIKLFGIPKKVYIRVLERRLHLVVQPQSHEEKCCFCPGRGCRPLSSQGYLRVSGSTTMCFMDLGKVFKNVSLNSVGGVSEVSPLWILYQSIILNKCQTSPLFCFLTSSANSIVIAIVNIQTGSID